MIANRSLMTRTYLICKDNEDKDNKDLTSKDNDGKLVLTESLMIKSK